MFTVRYVFSFFLSEKSFCRSGLLFIKPLFKNLFEIKHSFTTYIFFFWINYENLNLFLKLLIRVGLKEEMIILINDFNLNSIFHLKTETKTYQTNNKNSNKTNTKSQQYGLINASNNDAVSSFWLHTT
jgi:hypothetical protein